MSDGGGVVKDSADASKLGRGFFRKGFLWVVPQPRAHPQEPKRPSMQSFLKTALGGQRTVKSKGATKTSKFAPASGKVGAEEVVSVDELARQKRAPLAPPAPPDKEPAKLSLRFVDQFSSVSFLDEPPGKQQVAMSGEKMSSELPGVSRQSAKRKSFQDILQCNHVKILHEPSEELTPGPPLGRDPLWRAALLSADLPPGPGHMRGRPKAPLPLSPPKFAPKPPWPAGPEGEMSPGHCVDRVRRNLELMGAQRSELRELQGNMHSLLRPAKQRIGPATCG